MNEDKTEVLGKEEVRDERDEEMRDDEKGDEIMKDDVPRSEEGTEAEEEEGESKRRKLSPEIEDGEDDEQEYTCMICQQIMLHPTKTLCGHPFDMHCLARWLRRNKQCPMCRTAIHAKDLVVSEKALQKIELKFNDKLLAVKNDMAEEQRLAEEKDYLYEKCISRCPRHALLVKNMRKQGCLTDDRVEMAFLALPRVEFFPQHQAHQAYENGPAILPNHKGTSAPSQIVKYLQELNITPGCTVLDIGTGCGIVTALAAVLTGICGSVVGIDEDASIADYAREKIANIHAKKIADMRNVRILNENCFDMKGKKYDRIYSESVCPFGYARLLTDMLNPGGVLMTPIGSSMTLKLSKDKETSKSTKTFLFHPNEHSSSLHLPERATRTSVDYLKQKEGYWMCCLACSSMLFPASHVMTIDESHVELQNMDGRTYTVPASSLVNCNIESEENTKWLRSSVLSHRTKTGTLINHTMHNVFCAHCNIYLGVAAKKPVKTNNNVNSETKPNNETNPENQNHTEDSNVVNNDDINEDVNNNTNENNATDENNNNSTLVYITRAYTRLHTSDGRAFRENVGWDMSCEECDNVLSTSDQILSDSHAWKLPGNTGIEAAFYMNSLCPGSYKIGEPFAANLAQGKMMVAHVSCSLCRGYVGWGFVEKIDDKSPVYNTGRFGLVCSRFNVGSD